MDSKVNFPKSYNQGISHCNINNTEEVNNIKINKNIKTIIFTEILTLFDYYWDFKGFNQKDRNIDDFSKIGYSRSLQDNFILK